MSKISQEEFARKLTDLKARAVEAREANMDLWEAMPGDPQRCYVGLLQRNCSGLLAFVAAYGDTLNGLTYGAVCERSRRKRKSITLSQFPSMPDYTGASGKTEIPVAPPAVETEEEKKIAPFAMTMKGETIKKAERLISQILDGTHPVLRKMAPEKQLEMMQKTASDELKRYANPADIVRGAIAAQQDKKEKEAEERGGGVAAWVGGKAPTPLPSEALPPAETPAIPPSTPALSAPPPNLGADFRVESPAPAGAPDADGFGANRAVPTDPPNNGEVYTDEGERRGIPDAEKNGIHFRRRMHLGRAGDGRGAIGGGMG